MMIIVLFITATLTAMISAVVGMAGGIALLGVMTFFLPLKTIIPIHACVQLMSNSTRTLLLRQHVEWRVIVYYVLGLPLGTLIALNVIKSFSFTHIAMTLIVLLIWYVLFKPKKMPTVQLPYWGFGILAVVIGIINPFVGATGPLQAAFFLRDDWSKEKIVATKAMSQSLGHFFKLLLFVRLGFVFETHSLLIIVMVIGVVLGTKYGITLLSNIKDRTFRFLYRGVLFAASLRILYLLVVDVIA